LATILALPIIHSRLLGGANAPEQKPVPAPSARFADDQDDSGWINQAISAAIKAKATSYTLPAGTLYLKAPLVIPAGTVNFTLRGAGMNETLLVAPDLALDDAVVVGTAPVIYNNFPITKSPAIAVQNVAEGANSVKVAPFTSGLIPGRYYVLADDFRLRASGSTDTYLVRAELTKITSYNPLTGVVTLEKSAARQYDVKPKIYDVTSLVTRNITVRDMAFNGAMADGSRSSATFLGAGLVDGLNVHNILIRSIYLRAMDINTCRNVNITGTDVGYTDNRDAGSGYGITIVRSRFVNLTDNVATETRHGFVVHSGSTDVTFTRCKALGTNGNLDLHGYDERRIRFVDCYADGTFNMGNDKWLGGCQNVVLERCKSGSSLILAPNSRKITARDSEFGGIRATYDYDEESNPPGGPTDEVMLERCRIEGPGELLSLPVTFGTIHFHQSHLESTRTSWGRIFFVGGSPRQGKLCFESCTMVAGSLRKSDTPIYLQSRTDTVTVTIKNSVIRSTGGAQTALRSESAYKGKLSISGNRFESVNSTFDPVHFYINESTTAPVSNFNNSALSVDVAGE
jgi:hypothetical protein